MGTHSRVGSHRVRCDSRFFAEHGYLEVPSLVQWMATLRCGLHCQHCLAVSQAGGFDDMPLEKTRALIDEVAALGVREFLLTGGEPLAREDLGEVIEYLGRRGVSWTLNTAALPEGNLREVIARNPPGFVAVSLDGPREVHDEFRGRAGAWEAALEAIRFFNSLAGVGVCAGTTVTRRNYDYLDETFHLVAAGGADQWGIHLLVPEGRAATRRDLFLTRPQLKRLIKFVARKRRYFRVEMADEIGYLGYLEPLVRDVPLACGAGRSQCVILPDGEVVPCTTLDRSCSAGNIHERPLSRIWAEGFQTLRSWRPAGKCERCEYSTACRGGCWLQRKAGTQCFKDVWHVPGALKTAAGIAICLGGLAASGQAQEPVPPPEPNIPASQESPLEETTPDEEVVPGRATVPPDVQPSRPGTVVVNPVNLVSLDDAILRYYVDQAVGASAGTTIEPVDANEPAWKFFLDFNAGTLPENMLDRCAAVCRALETQERSLSLAALLWRAVSEPLFDPNNTTVYSDVERQVLRDTLAAIGLTAEEWRQDIFARNLDPYVTGGRQTQIPWSFFTKAGPRPGDRETYALSKDLNEERWGVGATPDTREAAETYVAEHHYAEQMDLTFGFYTQGSLIKYSAGETEVVPPHLDYGYGDHTLGVFDVIVAVDSVQLALYMEGDIIGPPVSTGGDENLLDDETRGRELSTRIIVTLEAGREYTYVELLNAIYYQQNGHSWVKDRLLAMADGWLAGVSLSLWNQSQSIVIAVRDNGPLLWPALKEIIAIDCAFKPYPIKGEIYPCTEVHRRAVLKDIDFWMF
jgi:radical SAM protein with 4Fe4S-binding SPASM domain